MECCRNNANNILFVTVGTTEFEQLIEAIDSIEFLQCINSYGYNKLIIQYGRGLYVPNLLVRECIKYNIEIEIFQFKSNLDQIMNYSNLIISHCGAGSILEAISLKKMLIVVINNSLQDNHQLELSNALVRGDYCISTIPSQIINAIHKNHSINNINYQNRKLFPINNPTLFSDLVDEHFGFDD